MIRKTKENDKIISKESRIGRQAERRNDAQKKHEKQIQDDERTRLNNYGEGICYCCNNHDRVYHSLFFICPICYQKRGKDGLMANVVKKEIEELCDICGYWKWDVWQRNVAFCTKCIDRVDVIHRKYRKKGQQELANNPFHTRLRRNYGKDWRELTGINV